MANTFKFGASNWATKEGSVLAYNDENGNFKPLPFNFTRATSATRVNKEGLIEVVGSNKPRIDYLNNADGHLLLEPSRTNNQVYSEEFDNALWGKVNVTISTNDAISPDGSQNADKISETSDTGLHVVADGQSFVSGTSYVFSCFAKKGTSKDFRIAAGNPATIPISSIFDLEDGTVTSSLGSSTSTIEYFGNGWYRCAVVATASATSATNLNLGLADGTTTNYTGNTSNNLYIWGAMVEEGNYATSYIPTSGSAVTRAVDEAIQTPVSNILSSSRGTIFLSFKRPVGSLDFSGFGVSDGTTNNEAFFRLTSEDTVEYYVRSGGSQTVSIINSSYNLNNETKIAVTYDTNYASMHINGNLIAIDTSVTTPASITKIHFSRSNGTLDFVGNIIEARYYDEVLSSAQLIALTS